MKYIVSDELRQIAGLVEVLNDKMGTIDIGLGKAPVIDANGDTLGHIDVCDGGMYAFILDYGDDE